MDYTDFEAGKEKSKTLIPSEPTTWWEAEEVDRAKLFDGAVKSLVEDQSYRSQMNLLHARLYGNIEILGFGIRDYARSTLTPSVTYTPRVNLNVVASAVDTLHAKITKNKPRPSFQTDGGTWKMQQKAQNLDKFIRGVYYETKIYRKGSEAFRDSEVFGTGGLKLCRNKKNRIELDRVFIDDIFVDDADGLHGEPCQMFHRVRLHRATALREYGFQKGDDAETQKKKQMAIRAAALPMGTPKLRGFSDVIEIWEGWMLPDENGKGGIHIIQVDGTELFCEEWKMKRFPFVFFRLFPRLLGFWGQGAAERLMGIQIELNRLMRSVSEQLRRKGRGRTFIRKGSKIPTNHLDNSIAPIIETVGDPRESVLVDNINAVAPEEFQQIDRLYQRAFQEIGLSELSVAAKKPSGLDAAVALREFNDIETERFAKPAQAWEDFFLDAAELIIDDMKVHGGYKVKVPSRRYTMEIDWADVDMDRDSYTMQMFPVSSLPQTPSARYQRVKEMMNDGFIDAAIARRLLDMPDIEAEEDLGNAALDDADAVIGAILDEDTPKLIPPEPYQNLQLIVQRATAGYLFARHHGCDDKRLSLLRDLIDMCTKLLVPPPAPPVGATAMGPQTPGMPPPGPTPAPGIAAPSPLLTGGINNIVNTGQGPQPVAPPVVG